MPALTEKEFKDPPEIPDYESAGYRSEIEFYYFRQDWPNFERKLKGFIGAQCRDIYPDFRQRSEDYRDAESECRTRVIAALFGTRPYDPQKGTFITFLYNQVMNGLTMYFYYHNQRRKRLVQMIDETQAITNDYHKYRRQIDVILDNLSIASADRPQIISYFLDRGSTYKNTAVLRNISWTLFLNNFGEIC